MRPFGTLGTWLQYSTAQYSTVQYSTVQYSTVQYSTVQYRGQGLPHDGGAGLLLLVPGVRLLPCELVVVAELAVVQLPLQGSHAAQGLSIKHV